MSHAVAVVVEHAPSLCYAMQQSAVPWLTRLALRNEGAAALRDLRVTLAIDGFVAPCVLHAAEVPAGAVLELPVPDVPLLVEAFANAIERTRADLVVTVTAGGEAVAERRSPIDVLAYNEWPGLAVLPALLAAFVTPNHPALAPLLQAVAARLREHTGQQALDGYQSGDAGRVRAMVAAVHEAITALGITYVTAPPSFERTGQKVRLPEQVLGERLGTCLDLALLGAAVFEHIGLRPFVVMLRGHAFAGVWLLDGSQPEVAFGPAVELKKRLELGAMAVVECTLACAGQAQPFVVAAAHAAQRLAHGDDFECAIDVAAARRTGIRPLPVRTTVFAPGAGPVAAVPQAAPAVAGVADDEAHGQAPPPSQPPLPPKDRLEHWKGKLLDLSMFNRLLNFAVTKKTVPLCAHDLEALENRLQQGSRMRVHARPELGQDGDPRDLRLASQRAGVDVMAQYLTDELKAGRLRADLDPDDLDERLVEIFRHARSSLEESGANTLYLAIGFLKYFETPQAEKPRRAPLLLVPLVAERTSVQEGVRFLLDDAEPRLNQTLLQFLQRDFDLRVQLGETPPEGEHGVDVTAVLDAFRVAALAMPRWEVEATACIGFFSFTKYLMWLDLADRERLLRSPVLTHLVERPGAAYAQDAPEVAREQLDELDPATVFCPKDADSSQLAAVLAAAGGRSFVLEGPPGTGKSQTITNLIAQALANEQRVLFVAEKRAALEVVQRRLADVGLGPFCLELHSSKSGPKAVLEQLRRALDLGQQREPAEWAKVAADLQAARRSLNRLVRELHRVREHGVSVFAAMGELVALGKRDRLDLPQLLERGSEHFGDASEAMATLAAAAKVLPVPTTSPWWGVQLVDWRPAINDQVATAMARLQRAAAALRQALPPIVAAFGLDELLSPEGPNLHQLAGVGQLVFAMTAPTLPPAAMLRASDWYALRDQLARACVTGRQRDAAWQTIESRWRREVLTADLERLAVAFARHAGDFFVLRWWRLREPRAQLAAFAIGGLGTASAIGDDLRVALRVRNDERALEQGTLAAASVGPVWNGGFADWAKIETFAEWVTSVRQAVTRMERGAVHPNPVCLEAIARQLDVQQEGAAALANAFAAWRAAGDEFKAAHDGVRTLLQCVGFGSDAPEEPGYLQRLEALAARCLAEVPALRDFCAYRGAAVAASQHGVRPLVDAHARGEVATEALVPTFRASFLRSWLDDVHTKEPALARFRGLDHERAIARFAELDQRAIRLAADVVAARLAARLPQLRDTSVASSELGLLEREIKKQRKHKPVRRLFGEIPGLLGRLAPCMLMSPLSVAQFLARGTGHFDLVVFDEASQIPMWDAVGAIGRGRSLVCVGDSRQLPPTSFFQRLAQGDEIGADEIPEDLESVLDECGAAGLPRMHLDWHYRSRHESLIAFSNAQYYRNRLLTFPAPQAIAPGLGVRAVRVAGVYDRAGSQTNRIEAEALVAEVTTRLADPQRKSQSLGIVTFSQAQQVLIENLLDEVRRQRPEFEAAFAASEPVFVKNLENVQGDERDVILFSIGYGPDAQGRVYENYGPLNLQGGERRLNVAVTRARRELVVFTSVGPEQVANRTAAIGAKHLRTFLDYALRGAVALAEAAAAVPGGEVESPFEHAVRDALVARGHEVHVQIGCSGYRIDLAVVDRDAPGRYLLGIECDGATYHGAATARDRDRLRAAVLRGLGWRLHRVWSTDFWLDPQGEIARIEQALADARRAAAAAALLAPVAAVPAPAPPPSRPEPAAATSPATPATPAAPAAPTAPPAAVAADDPDGPRPYTVATLPAAGTPEAFQGAAALPVLREQITTLLAVESPLVFDRLARTVATAWDLSRLTDRVRERIRSALPAGAVVDGDVVWADAAARRAFRGFRVPEGAGGDAAPRSAEELPPLEIEHAMQWLLRQHQALAVDDLAREAARCFGITRLGTVVREVMAAGIERLVAGEGATRDGDIVRLA